MRLIKILLFILISYNGFSQNIGIRQVRGLQGALNAKYSSATTLPDSTGFTLNRPNGTKDTIQIAIPSAIDTTGRFVNKITKNATNDSFYVWKGTGYTALNDNVGSGGSGSGGLDTSAIHKTGDETIRSGIKTFSSPITGVVSSPTILTTLKSSPTITAAQTSDTLAALYLNPTFAGSATTKQWGMYSTKDISVNGVRIGTGRAANDNSSVVFGWGAFDAQTAVNTYQVAVGYQALKLANTSSTNNVGVGLLAGGGLTSGGSNVAIGPNAMSSVTGTISNNVAVGSSALGSVAGGNNVGIGASAGRNGGSGNVSLGFNAGQNETGSNKLNINNSNVGGLIVGDFLTGQVLINGNVRLSNPASVLTTPASFEVQNYNSTNTNRGSIPSPVVTQAQRDAIALQTGVVTRIFLASVGTGYTTAPTVSIGGTGTGATATATAVNGSIYITVTNGGTGYTPNTTTVTLTGGAGTGAAAYAIVGNSGLSVFCLDCTATDGSVGVTQNWNGTAWKNNW